MAKFSLLQYFNYRPRKMLFKVRNGSETWLDAFMRKVSILMGYVKEIVTI